MMSANSTLKRRTASRDQLTPDLLVIVKLPFQNAKRSLAQFGPRVLTACVVILTAAKGTFT